MVFCPANQSTSPHVAPGTRGGARYQPISVFNSETRNCVVFRKYFPHIHTLLLIIFCLYTFTVLEFAPNHEKNPSHSSTR